jgi:transposase InsO family protein
MSLIRYRAATFTNLFNVVLASEGIRIIKTRSGAPRVNAIMQRWVGSRRREVLDRLLIVNAPAPDPSTRPAPECISTTAGPIDHWAGPHRCPCCPSPRHLISRTYDVIGSEQ